MPADRLHIDALILGGGIAGLWTLARLTHEGRSALLLEVGALGGGQTIWSQGIIHGGIKYALTGLASAASRAIAAMPEVWRGCLAGNPAGDGAGVDLSTVTPLATGQHLWTTPGLLSRLAGVAAGAAIRTPVESLARDRWPAEFAGAPGGTNLYTVAEPVLDSRQVVAALGAAAPGRLAHIREVEAIDPDTGNVDAVLADGSRLGVRAGLVVLAAGAGNQPLAALAGLADAAPMQRRPLHMVMVRGKLPSIFGHCLGASTVPRVTITSASWAGQTVWYVGGGLAEDGAARSEADQIDAARQELAACLPWVDSAAAKFAAGRIDRAEGLLPGRSGARPDTPVIVRRGRVLVVWPTKLAFAPAVATEVARAASQAPPADSSASLPPFAAPPVALPPWEAARAWV